MCDDAPEQPGTRRTADAHAVGLGLAVVIVMIVLEGSARAQPGGDLWDTVPVHPDVTTVLRLPDEVERVRFSGPVAGLIRATTLGDKVLLRPHRGAPAWDEVSLQVKTATVRVRFRLRPARHARDAWRNVVVRTVVPVQCAEPEVPAAPAASASSSAPAPAAPVASEPATPESAVTTAPQRIAEAGNATAAGERDVAADADRDAMAGSQRFEVSVHAVAALAGTTEVRVAGYQAIDARQPHRAFGVRVAVAPPGAWWAVETNISGEWLAAPTVHRGVTSDPASPPAPEVVAVSGPRLRADVGMRARWGTRWSPTVHAGFGLHAHHRDIEKVMTDPMLDRDQPTRAMPLGGVLALGTGLTYRAGDVFLGLDFQVRQGVLADYRSVAVLLSVGCLLERGE